MKIIQSIMTKNDCYKAGKTITVKGLMIHSVGCSQPSAMVFINQWNKPASEQGGRQVAVHGFIEANGDVYQCLPWNHRAWHCGSGANGSGNNTHVSFEMTEPATIAYTGGASWTDKDTVKTKAFVLGTYKTTVELFASLCTQFKLDPLADGVIISHSEGHKRGIASNHGDVEHIWNKFGLTMVQFRKDIKAAMGGVSVTPTPTSETPTKFAPYTVKVTTSELNIRKGAGTNFAIAGAIKDKGIYTIVEESTGAGAKLWGKLKSGAGWISLDFTEKK